MMTALDDAMRDRDALRALAARPTGYVHLDETHSFSTERLDRWAEAGTLDPGDFRTRPFGARPSFSITHVDHNEREGNMRTYSGKWIDPAHPDPDDLDLVDIAHALARLCRFGGHTATTYTVAEHSIHVADQLWRTTGALGLAAAGLMHDATEAYLGDVIRPVKRLVPEYKAIEARWASAIAYRFDLAFLADPRVKATDEAILPWEMAMFRECRLHRPSDPETIAEAFLDKAVEYGVSSGSRFRDAIARAVSS